jgi:TPP-dependent pyruvate/acetoin dehydrogenase alpha subunit
MTSNAAGRERLTLMLRARRFDEALIRRAELVCGVFHVGVGQEATAAAIVLTRAPGDVVMLNHRSHHHLLAGGADPESQFAEIFGRDRGPYRGRNGTLHLADPECGVHYTSAMVGGTVPLGLGLALARKRRGEPGIAFCCFGDGALGEGLLYECFNIAQLWQLPVVFVCESNSRLAAGTANSAQSAASLTDLPAAHRVRSTDADATDPGAIQHAIDSAATEVRGGGGPRFVLAQSVPWPGNSSFIPGLPDGPTDLERCRLEAQGWDAHDPILRELRAMVASGLDLQEVLAEDADIVDEMEAAAAGAASAALAPSEAAFENVWAEA